MTIGIHISKWMSFFDHIFEYGVLVYEANSGFDTELRQFSSLNELKDYASFKLQTNKDINLSLHYADTCGQVFTEKHELNSDECNGAKFRYTTLSIGTSIFFDRFYSVTVNFKSINKFVYFVCRCGC